jgi:hypothetical protein
MASLRLYGRQQADLVRSIGALIMSMGVRKLLDMCTLCLLVHTLLAIHTVVILHRDMPAVPTLSVIAENCLCISSAPVRDYMSVCTIDQKTTKHAAHRLQQRHPMSIETCCNHMMQTVPHMSLVPCSACLFVHHWASNYPSFFPPHITGAPCDTDTGVMNCYGISPP